MQAAGCGWTWRLHCLSTPVVSAFLCLCAGLPARLEVALEAQGQKLVLTDFALAELELDSALALLEHLAELSD